MGQLGSTKMLCEPAVMDQEQVVLSLLETAGGFALDEQGQLTLRSGDGRTLTARPLRQ